MGRKLADEQVQHVKGTVRRTRAEVAFTASLLWLCLLGASAPGATGKDARWFLVGTFADPGGEGWEQILLDTVSLKPADGLWTITQQDLFSSAQKTEAGASFTSELDVYAYDCRANRAAVVSYKRYEHKELSGGVVDEMHNTSPREYKWLDPAPGSALEAARRVVCGLAGKRPTN